MSNEKDLIKKYNELMRDCIFLDLRSDEMKQNLLFKNRALIKEIEELKDKKFDWGEAIQNLTEYQHKIHKSLPEEVTCAASISGVPLSAPSSPQNDEKHRNAGLAILYKDPTENQSLLTWKADDGRLTKLHCNSNHYDKLTTVDEQKLHIQSLERMLLAYVVGRGVDDTSPIVIGGSDPISRAILIKLCALHNWQCESAINEAETKMDVTFLKLITDNAKVEQDKHHLPTDLIIKKIENAAPAVASSNMPPNSQATAAQQAAVARGYDSAFTPQAGQQASGLVHHYVSNAPTAQQGSIQGKSYGVGPSGSPYSAVSPGIPGSAAADEYEALQLKPESGTPVVSSSSGTPAAQQAQRQYRRHMNAHSNARRTESGEEKGAPAPPASTTPPASTKK